MGIYVGVQDVGTIVDLRYSPQFITGIQADFPEVYCEYPEKVFGTSETHHWV